jgi:ribonucleoside-diphosphate reductase alpha chain
MTESSEIVNSSRTDTPIDRPNFDIDPNHARALIFDQQISHDIWEQKYKFKEEVNSYETMMRICSGVYAQDLAKHHLEASDAMIAGLWVPGGRINAGAGTDRQVTFMNCYVLGTLQDSMEGIADGLKGVMVTLKKGGGIGTDFSPLRPRGAELKHLGSGAYSSGAVSFMRIWNAASATIMSAGSRRGAMMATLRCNHPDLLEFIEAKQTKGTLEHFNVSVLCTDEFMDAVKNDYGWALSSEHRPAPPIEPIDQFVNSHGKMMYVYHRMKARALWDHILQATYTYAEPGVIFIDRVNKLNNLNYCESIDCTNPCGEQPLPPNGACNLGHVNVARMVKNPFTQHCEFDFDLLAKVVRMGVRFLDNVIDVSDYPLEAQALEQKNKRRIGLGITGLGNALDMMRMAYGTPDACKLAGHIQQWIAIQAYDASCDLAKEKGKFPLFSQQFVEQPFIQKLPEKLQRKIRKYGIRNGVLLTQAPVGTGSLWFGNVSSGIEPVFARQIRRKVLQRDNQWKLYEASDYGWLLWTALGNTEPAPWMVTAQDLGVGEHIGMQAAIQEWVDASISKTINVPEKTPFEAFRHVYSMAYDLGCKGVTTYRPNTQGQEIRGSILEPVENSRTVVPVPSIPSAAASEEAPLYAIESEQIPESLLETKVPSEIPDEALLLEPRPHVLVGATYQLKWPHREAAIYMTVNSHGGSPHEVLFTSRSMQDMPWLIALGRMLSAMLRLEIDTHFICNELSEVRDAYESAWVSGKQYGSIVALIGETLRHHLEENGSSLEAVAETNELGTSVPSALMAKVCPKCSQQTLIPNSGCDTCMSCGYSKC